MTQTATPQRLLIAVTGPVIGLFFTPELAGLLGQRFQSTTIVAPALAPQRAAAEPYTHLCALLDPAGVGLALARELQRRQPELRVLLLSTPQTPPLQRAAAWRRGFRVAPASPPALVAAFTTLLRAAPTAGAPEASHGLLGEQLREALRQLGRHAGVQCALLATTDGAVAASWRRDGDMAVEAITPLVASSLAATGQLAQLFGLGQPGSLVLQEHDDYLVLIVRAGAQHVLLLLVGADAPLGPLRLALRRVADQVAALLAAPPPRHQLTPTSVEPAAHARQVLRVVTP